MLFLSVKLITFCSVSIFCLCEQYCYFEGFDHENPTNATCIPAENMSTYDYYGLRNLSKSNKTCMQWFSDGADKDYLDTFNKHNFCRNIPQKGAPEGPWCYTAPKRSAPESCFEKCDSNAKICIDVTTTTPIPTVTYGPVTENKLEIQTQKNRKRKRRSKVGLYVEPLTTVGFWTIVCTVIALIIMCALFPLIRMYAARRALLKEGQTDEKHKEAVESYRILLRVFRERNQPPPSFEQFLKKRLKLGPKCDPKEMLGS